MIASSYPTSRIAACFCSVLLLLISGCLNPGMNRNFPGAYGQPMYAPPQTINPAAPGNLYIPPSQGPAYNPGGTDDSGVGTYDDDPDDDFNRSPDDGRFFNPKLDEEEGVPQPKDRLDDLGLGVDGIGFRSNPSSENRNIQQLSELQPPREYGFDTHNYQWLRGTIQRDPYSHRWLVRYNPSRDDGYQGILSLDGTNQQMSGVRDGDWIDVRGHLHSTEDDRSGRPLFVVEGLARLEP